MQEFYLRDYDVNLKFPDGMSEKRIKGIIERDYPEPDEKLVARFENPDTPAASLSKEDHERYLQARPEMTAGRFAGMAADAFTSTAGRLLTNLPEFLKTFAMSPIEMGVSARTLAEGFARGTYDTETMGRMAEGYLMSKVEGFGGRTNDEKENQYRRFLKVKELQNVRSKIDRGDKSAWNEYMEWAGANGAKIDPEKFNQGAAEFLGEFADPSLLIPGSKIGTAIAKTTGRVTGGAVSAAGDMMSAGGRRLSDLRSSATDAMGNLASKVDEASGGLGRYAVPGGVGAAVGVGALDLGTAGMGTLAVAGIPAAMEVAGGLLRNFGDAMKVNPTRSGGLARMALNSPDTAAGYLAGKLQFLDTPTNYAGRAASGAVTGVGIGAGIGLATGGVEGLAQGIGSGGAMGAFGGTMGRFVEGATGAAKRAAQDSDLVTWLESKSDEDRASLGRYKNRDDLIRAMDLEQVILGSTSEAEPIIRYGTDETVIGQDAQGKDITLKGGGGAYTQEGGRPVIHLNTNSDLRTLAHETFHAIARIDGFEVMVQRIKDQVGKLYKDQEIDTLINDYEKSGKLLVTDDTPGKSDRDKKFNSILEEIGAEYFANYIKGKDSNYLFKGNPIREAIRGITDRFVAGKLDRVHNTFKSDIFDTPIKQSKALNRSIDDLVRARRRSKRNINLSVDTPVRVYSDFDLKDDAIFQELVDMGAARVTATGKREMIKTDYQVKKIEAERAKTMAKVLDSVDDTGGLIRDERGNYSGLRFSKQQIDALLASDAITGTLRKALEKIKEMPDDSGLMNVLYAAATTKTKKGSRYRNLPLSNRDAILFNFIISPQTRTMRVKVVDKTLLDQRVAKEFANPETQKEFGSMEEMQRDLLTYLNALSSGQTPTAEVLGSAKKRDILNKVLKVRNQKGNPLVPEGTKFNEAKNDHPWRDFRLDRIVQMTTRETKVNFSEDAYNRARVNFRPRTFEPGQTTVLKPADLARFSPSPDNPNIDLRDLNNKKIQVLTTDSSGARDRNANGVAVQFRGGPGHLALYDGWGFTNINSAKAFITRLRRDGFPLVGITSMKPNNHLNSKLARRYYGLKWEELVETGKVTAREANKHIKEAMKRIINSKAGKSPLTKQQMSTIAGIKTYKDFARVFEEIPWKAAPVLYTKLDGKTLPIKQSRLKELGMDLETIANELREPAYEGIGPGTLLAIAEYGGKPPEYRPELNENYPYFVGLKEKAFLKEFTEVTNLTSRKDVATKSGKPNSAVLMGAGVVLDKLASGEVKFSPQSKNPSKLLSPDDFYKKYKATHIIYPRDKPVEQVFREIQDKGFNEGFNVNAMPFAKGADQPFSEKTGFDRRVSPKAGDFVVMLEESGIIEGPNGYKTKQGYVPDLALRIQSDDMNLYQTYLQSFGEDNIRLSPQRMGSLASGEGPVLPKVEPPILQGPSANVVSLAKVKAEISKEKSPKVVDNTEIQEDIPVGLRLDIPTYERTIKAGQPVFPVAVHEKWQGKQAGKAGKVIGYTNIAAVKNPVFTVNEKAAESIKGGKAKSTIATVEGLYSKTREIPEDINTWTQVGMNPRRHSYFYDRETGQPVIGGDVAISSGNTVFVKNPIYDSPGRFRFSPERMDAEHAKAIDSGDTAVARKLVDNAANKAGFTVKVKRGDGKAFNRFDKSRRGESTKALSAKKAFFFTGSESAAGTFARMSSNNEAETVLRADQKGIQAKIDELQPQAFKDIEQALNDPQTDIEPYVREWGKKLLRKNTLHRIPLTVVSNSNFFNSPAVKEWYDASISRVDEQTPSWLAERERTKKKIGLSEDGVVREFFLNLNNYDVIDYGGKTSRLGPTTYSDAIDKALAAGKDGVVFKNTEDAGEVINIYATFEPNQAKSADLATYDNEGNLIPLSQRFNKQSDDIRFSPQRELDSLGMYSKAQEAIEGMQQKRGTGQQFLKAMEKAGVKSEEIEDIGLDTFLKDNPRVNKEEVLDFMRSHQVEIKEVNQTPRGDAWVVDNRHAGWDERFSSLEDAEDYRRQGFEEFAAAEISENGVTITQDPQTLKWSVVDGTGTQYLAGQFDTKLAASRKMQSDLMADFTSNNPIVQLQEASDATSHSNWVEPGAVPLTYTEKLFTLQKRKTADFRFGSFVNKNHFTQPDIIAHVRHNDRIGPDGEKILFLEEVQSDWHQAGSDTGYGERLPQKEVEELEGLEYVDGLQVDKANMERLIKGLPAGPEKDKVTLTYQGFMRDDYQPMTRDMKIRRRVLREKEFAARKGAGNAPFKRSWRSLAMKRMLKVAADEGYDAIAWTTGDAQNARYSLGSKITGLEVIDTGGNTYEIAARMPGEDVFRTVEIGVTKEKLPEYIGKETTKRALEGMEEGIAILEEGDLRLGGRFLRSVYDEKLPQLKIWKQTKDGNGNRLKPVRKMISDDLEANYVALNDSVRKKISSQGMPRYSPEVKLNKTKDLNNRGGAIYTNERGDRAVQTSLRAGIRIYSKQGKRIGPVFKSIEKAERHLAKMGK